MIPPPLWSTQDEWVGLAPCGEDIRFIKSPEDLGPTETRRVRKVCQGCSLRPECIELNVAPVMTIELKKVRRPSSSMWVAGQWLPDPHSASSRRELEKLRGALVASLPGEYAARPDAL